MSLNATLILTFSHQGKRNFLIILNFYFPCPSFRERVRVRGVYFHPYVVLLSNISVYSINYDKEGNPLITLPSFIFIPAMFKPGFQKR